MCQKSSCCPSGHGGGLAVIVIGAVLAVAAWLRIRHTLAHIADLVIHWAIITGIAGLSAAAVFVSARFAVRHRGEIRRSLAHLLAGRSARRLPIPSLRWVRHIPLALWVMLTWRSLFRRLALVSRDRQVRSKVGADPARMHHPPALALPSRYGVTVRMLTVAGVDRVAIEKQAPHLANAWRCARVQVSQRAPGKLTVRGLRTDPLARPFGIVGAPAGVYTHPHPFRPYVGLDEWAKHRYLDLSGITGVTIAGLPGLGKTSLILSLLHQLAGTAAVQFVFVDGKGGGDYAGWSDRAWLHCDDELPRAAEVLEDVHGLMRKRLSEVGTSGRPRNMWHVGPSEEWPLIVTVVDEAHTFYDLEAIKSDREAEKYVRTCRALSGQLVKKGRSVLFLTILITQKQTGDAIPTAIRDNCALGFSFGVKTRDAAVAGLGEAIRDYPSYCPTGLQERPTYVGVCTSSLPTGADPFVRLRVPEISEEAADARARETAHLRRDPSALLPTVADLAPVA